MVISCNLLPRHTCQCQQHEHAANSDTMHTFNLWFQHLIMVASLGWQHKPIASLRNPPKVFGVAAQPFPSIGAMLRQRFQQVRRLFVRGTLQCERREAEMDGSCDILACQGPATTPRLPPTNQTAHISNTIHSPIDRLCQSILKQQGTEKMRGFLRSGFHDRRP